MSHRSTRGRAPQSQLTHSQSSGTVVWADPADFYEDDSHVWILDKLAKRPAVEIAVDTEFEGTDALTIQFAMRIGQDVVVQLYRSPHVPTMPKPFPIDKYLPRTQYGRFCRKVILRPVQMITSTLSLADVVLDLVGLHGLRTDSRGEGRTATYDRDHDYRQACDTCWDEKRGRWNVPTVKVHLIGHFLSADLGRCLGARFVKSLLEADRLGSHPLALQTRKLLALVPTARSRRRLWSSSTPGRACTG